MNPVAIQRTISEIWNEGFLKLGQMYADAFTSNKMKIGELAENKSFRDILSTVYGVLVRRKMIIPIGELSQDHKTELWNEAKSIGAELNQIEKIKLSRAIYALGTLLN